MSSWVFVRRALCGGYTISEAIRTDVHMRSSGHGSREANGSCSTSGSPTLQLQQMTIREA